MKNEVKKKMMMQEHEVAVPKSLRENFCKRNVQRAATRPTFVERKLFVKMIADAKILCVHSP